MKNDDMLPELARVVKEDEASAQERWDERWDRLAAGTLSGEEEAELAAMARTDPEVHALYEAFRPLDGGFQARVVEAIREQAAGAASAPAAPDMVRGRLQPATPWWRGRPLWLGFGGLATAGAAVALVLLVRPAPLPGYSFEVASGTREYRAEGPGEPLTFRPGDLLKIEASPAVGVAGGRDLAAEVYLAGDETFLPVAVRAEVAESGAMRLGGKLPDDLAPGLWRLWIVVGRPGELPAPAELRSLSADLEHRARSWVAMPQEIEVRPP